MKMNIPQQGSFFDITFSFRKFADFKHFQLGPKMPLTYYKALQIYIPNISKFLIKKQ